METKCKCGRELVGSDKYALICKDCGRRYVFDSFQEDYVLAKGEK